jgi:putative transposase
MIELLDISERRACCYAGLSRTSYREPPVMNTATQELGARIVELAHQRRRFGYRRIHDLLRREGHEVNHKRVWRLYKMNELSVRKRRKAKRVNLERAPLQASRHVNDTWSADFVMDALASSRRIKCLTVVDDFSRECVDIAIDYGMGGHYVARLLDAVGQFRGYPRAIRTDQGPEFTSRAFMAWANSRGVKHLINDAGKPTQNAYIESFNGKFRDECLNEQWFESLHQARQEVARWRRDYNEVRPHSAIGRIPPAQFAAAHRRLADDAQHQPEIQ